MKSGEKSSNSQQTFTLRNTIPDVRQTVQECPSRIGRNLSVFEPTLAPHEYRKPTQKDKKSEPSTSKKKAPEKKKKGNLEIDSDECLHIEFAELLAEPENKYIPSLHGWRYWESKSEWIDPDAARMEATEAVEKRNKDLPSKKYGPPLP